MLKSASNVKFLSQVSTCLKNSLKNIQNWFTFNPVVPNLADSCVFQYDEISSEWLFETPHPYPNNFQCSRTIRCPHNKYIHYRFHQLKIDSKDNLSGQALTRLRDFLKITSENGYEGQGPSQQHFKNNGSPAINIDITGAL